MSLTVADLRNPKRKSGYERVEQDVRDIAHPFRSTVHLGTTNGRQRFWHGPRRATAEAAAQDYCDYMNNGSVTPAAQLRSAGHAGKRERLPDDPEIQAALGVLRDARGQREGNQGYVYCIAEVPVGGGLYYGKIGYSTNPQARVSELQTGNPRNLQLLCATKGTVEDEARLHTKYINDNVLQEWFRLSRELLLEFDLDPDLNPYPTEDGKVIE